MPGEAGPRPGPQSSQHRRALTGGRSASPPSPVGELSLLGCGRQACGLGQLLAKGPGPPTVCSRHVPNQLQHHLHPCKPTCKPNPSETAVHSFPKEHHTSWGEFLPRRAHSSHHQPGHAKAASQAPFPSTPGLSPQQLGLPWLTPQCQSRTSSIHGHWVMLQATVGQGVFAACCAQHSSYCSNGATGV